MSGCGHGKTFKEPCTECQLVLAREGLAWAQQSVAKYSKLIADLAPEKSAEEGPWIEWGLGWAKVFFRREVTERDRAALAAAILNEPQAASKPEAWTRQAVENYFEDWPFWDALDLEIQHKVIADVVKMVRTGDASTEGLASPQLTRPQSGGGQ